MLDMFKSKSRKFPDVSVVDHINVCKFSHLYLRSGAISKSGNSTNIKALFPVVLTRIFPYWSMSKVEKAVKRSISRKVEGGKSNPKIYTVSKLRAMVKGRSTERATIKKASRGMQHAKMHHAIKHNAEDFRKYSARN